MGQIPSSIMQKAQEYKSAFQDFQVNSKNIIDTDLITKNYIKDAEGHKGYMYKVGGKDHIGYGHLITEEEKKLGTFSAYTEKSGNRLPQTEQNKLFEKDYSLKKGMARSRYGNREFDRLAPKNKALLIDYDYLGITQGEKGGSTKLSQLIKSASPDEAILSEAQRFMLRDAKGNMYKEGTNTRRKKQEAVFSKLAEIGISPVQDMLATMDKFHNGESKEILNALYPSIQADKQIAVWKTQLSKFHNKDNFNEDDLFKLEGIIAHQFREIIGGLD